MSLETAQFVNQLNGNNPDGAVDLLSTSDDHLRLIKTTLLNSFPYVGAAIGANSNDIASTQYVVDTGSANAIVLAPAPAWTSYTAGIGITFKAAATSTGATTVKVNSLAAIALNNNDTVIAGTNLGGGRGGMDISPLVAAINEVRNAVNALAAKPAPAMAIQVGAEKLGEVVGRQSETGTNQYKNAYRLA